MKTHRIAIIGYGNSGKTVFLTSLIWNLINWNPDEVMSETSSTDQNQTSYEKMFKLQRTIHSFREPEAQEDRPTFPYYGFREKLEKRLWPEKTNDVSFFRLNFKRTIVRREGKFNPLKPVSYIKIVPNRYKQIISPNSRTECIELFDIPGERMSDILIYMHKGYSDWCSDVLKELKKWDPDVEKLILKDVGDKQDENEIKEKLLKNYKEFLSENFVNNRNFLLTPSSFIISFDGIHSCKNSEMSSNSINEENKCEFDNRKENLLHNGILGIDREHEFCPLPKKFLKNKDNRIIVETFEKNYKEYKKKVSSEIFDIIRASEGIGVLLDIPEIIRKGPNHKTENETFVALVLKALNYSFFQKVMNGSKRVAFIANKSDLIRPEDREKLPRLLKVLVTNAASGHNAEYGDLEAACTYCSSCISTKEQSYDDVLRIIDNMDIEDPEKENLKTDLVEGTQLFACPIMYDEDTNERKPQGYEINLMTKKIFDRWENREWEKLSDKEREEKYNCFNPVWPLGGTYDDVPPESIKLDEVFEYLLDGTKYRKLPDGWTNLEYKQQ